ncbi:MAG: hypothetical protein O3C43_24585 [Verrucomicrobia bacterium]|nr:hypothetical protein [Verrucomicrobiota bacterium]MDA1069666.1 hypothetical protein [Verrucomicrobiota bacterium]
MSEKHPNPPRSKIRAAALIQLALASGACALAYEVLIIRMLTTLFGDLFYVQATILATFLLGIGIGAKISTRQQERLWIFEISTGVYALLLTGVAAWIYEQSWLPLVTGSPALTVVATGTLALTPGILIGFSIPLFSGQLKDTIPGKSAFSTTYLDPVRKAAGCP